MGIPDKINIFNKDLILVLLFSIKSFQPPSNTAPLYQGSVNKFFFPLEQTKEA